MEVVYEENSKLEVRSIEIIQSENKQLEKKKKKKALLLRDLWDNIRKSNIHLIRVPGKRKERMDQNNYLKKQ